MNIAELLADDDEKADEKPIGGAGVWPYPLAVQPALLPGRSRLCGFWVSALATYGTFYVVDTTQLAGIDRWVHNPAKDAIPQDALLVVVNPMDAQHIRKAMATYSMAPSPAFIAARIIDSQCREDLTLAGRMRWKL